MRDRVYHPDEIHIDLFLKTTDMIKMLVECLKQRVKVGSDFKQQVAPLNLLYKQ
ncbi:MAG: hypothetical protein R2827_06335 [Bdellovibrionales bacterium]